MAITPPHVQSKHHFVAECTAVLGMIQLRGDPALPGLAEQPDERPPEAHLGRGQGVRARVHPARSASVAARAVHPPFQGTAGPDQRLRPPAPQERLRRAHPRPAEAPGGSVYEGARGMSYNGVEDFFFSSESEGESEAFDYAIFRGT